MKKGIIISFVMLFVIVTNCFAQKRVALIVGNSSYETTKSSLATPENDARAMWYKLDSLGYKCMPIVLDGDLNVLRSSLKTFCDSASGADVALFYYSGHAACVDKVNYLLPSNVVWDPDYYANDWLAMSSVYKSLSKTGVKMKVVILDACRNNPLGDLGIGLNSQLKGARSVDINNGLNQNAAPEGFFTIYASQEGKPALANSCNSKFSPFTQALLENIDKDLELTELLPLIRKRVDELTSGQQHPTYDPTRNYNGKFYFNPKIICSNLIDKTTSVAFISKQINDTTFEVKYSNGDIYVGGWKNNKKNGYGFVTSKEQRSESFFVDDLENGYAKVHYYADSCRYEGECKGGYHDGKGKLIFKNGEYYDGYWKKGKKHGKGKLYTRIFEYEGEFYEDVMEGYGKVINYDVHCVYEGYFKRGKFEGHGKLTLSDSTVYEGEWKKGDMVGVGTYFAADGNKYKGTLEGLNWTGETYLKNGMGTYQGYLVNGLFDGYGILTTIDGSVYKGNFKEGKYHGVGIWETYDGLITEGDFVKGEPCGMVSIQWPNGNMYRGEYRFWKCNGKGVMNYADGSVYDGGWKDDHYDGFGTFSDKNGTFVEGTFENGNLKCGKGIWIYGKGVKFEGDFKNNVLNGFGSASFSDGSVCSGEFKDGILINGKQKVCYSDDYSFEYDIVNGKKNGKGRIKCLAFLYEGDFSDGVANGVGVLINHIDGTKYEGEFKNGKRHGKGRCVYPNGDIWVGQYEEDTINGQVTIYCANGDVVTTNATRGLTLELATCKHPDGKEEEGKVVVGVFVPNLK